MGHKGVGIDCPSQLSLRKFNTFRKIRFKLVAGWYLPRKLSPFHSACSDVVRLCPPRQCFAQSQVLRRDSRRDISLAFYSHLCGTGFVM